VLSGAGGPERIRMAMGSVDEHLVRREHVFVQLLDVGRLDVPPRSRVAARVAAGNRRALRRTSLPAHWHGVTISYRHRETVHHLAIVPTAAGEDQRGGEMLDGVEFDGQAIPLVDHRQEHAVAVRVRVNATADVRDVPAAEPQLA